MFYDYIDYAIEIPKGFETAFLNGETELLHTESRPDNAHASAIAMYIDSYLNNMHVYHTATSMELQEMHDSIMHNLQDQLEVSMVVKENVTNRYAFRNSYYNYFSYVIMALITSVVGATMISIFRNDVFKRNLISPITNSSMSIQLLFANILLATIMWAVFSVVSVIFTLDMIATYSGMLYLLNSYLFTVVCTSLAYMFSCILIDKANSSDTLNGISNSLSLGSAFLCGAFVPQAFIGASILQFSKFLPSFWFVKANDIMGTGDTLLSSDYTEIWKCLGVEVMFGLAFLMVALVIMRNKRSQEAFLAPGEQKV